MPSADMDLNDNTPISIKWVCVLKALVDPVGRIDYDCKYGEDFMEGCNH